MNPLIAIIDYGAGNLRSIQRALEAAGAKVTITSDPAEIVAADGVVFPGVGNAGAAMDRLHAMDIPPAIGQTVQDRKPFLGICLGMQLMFEYQEEGETQGLGLLPGRVRTLAPEVKSPQIGWNRVRFVRASELGTGGEEDDFYFVHSYIVDPENPDDIVATTHYGDVFPVIVVRDNIMGTQFHPEKSGTAGLELVASFVEQVRTSAAARDTAVPA